MCNKCVYTEEHQGEGSLNLRHVWLEGFCLPLLVGEVRFVVKKVARYEPNGVKQSFDPNLELLKHSF